MAILLGTASASVTLNVAGLMGPADQAISKLNELNAAGQGGRGPTVFDRLHQGALGLGTALIAPMALGVRGAVALEQTMANVNAAFGGLDTSTLEGLEDTFQRIGTASRFSAVEVGGIGEALAKSGFGVDEIDNATQAVVNLSQATGTDLVTSANGIVQALATWDPALVGVETGLTDATQAADILTIAANQSSASVGDILAGMRPLGPVAASMGIGYDEAAAAIAVFTNNGLSGADAGVSLARGLQNLADPTSEATALLGDLGISAFDMEGKFVGFPSLFDQLQTNMAGMSDQTQLAALSTIFGAEAMDVMGLAILNGKDPLEAMIALMGQSGAAAEQSALRMDTLGAQFDTLKEGVMTFLASLVEGLMPGMRLFVDTANLVVDALMRIPGPIKNVIGALAGLLAGYAAITRAVQGFQALNGLMNSLGGGAVAANQKNRSLLGTMLRFVPALALIGGGVLAWQQNMFGIQDSTKAFTKGFKQWWDVLGETEGIDPVTRALASVGKGFQFVEKRGGPLGRVAGSLGRGFLSAARFTDAFANALGEVWRTGGLTQSTLKGIPEPLQATTRGLLRVADGAFDLIRAFDEGGLAGVWKALPAELSQMASGFRMLGGEMQRGAAIAAGWILDVGAPAVGGWLADHADDAWNAIASAAGWAWDGLVRLADWTLEVAVPAIAAFGWDVAAAVLPFINGTIVHLTNWIAQLDGVEIVNGTLDMVGAITQWIIDNPIPTILIGAAALSMLFFGVPGIAFLFLGGLAFLIGAAMLKEMPSEVIVPTIDLLIKLAGFAIVVEGFVAEVMQAIGLQAIALILSWNAFWDRFEWDIKIGPFTISFDLGGGGFDIDWHSTPIVGDFLRARDNLRKLMEFEFSDLKIDLSMPEINWPDVSIDIGTIPFVTDFVAMLGNIAELLGSIDWTFEVDLPTVDWPGADELLALVPDDVIDFLTDPWGWVKGQLGGGGSSEGSTIPVVPTGTGSGVPGSGGKGYEMPYNVTPIVIPPGLQTYLDTLNQIEAATGRVKEAVAGMFGGGRDAGGEGGGPAGAIVGITSTITAEVTKWPVAIATASAAMGAAALNAGAVAGFGVVNGLAMAAGQIAGSLAAWPAAVNGVAPAMGSAGLNAGAVAGYGAANGIASARGSISGNVAVWPGIINGVAGSMGSAGFNAGAAAGYGVANGISSAVGAVQAAANEIAAIVATTIALRLLINSPSKVLSDLMRRGVGPGVAQGILAGIPDVTRASAMMADAVVPRVPSVAYAAARHQGGGSYVTNNTPIEVHVTVEGNVTTENQLVENTASRISESIVRGVRQRNIALGFSS